MVVSKSNKYILSEFIKKSRAGMTLIEILVALGVGLILLILVLGLYSITSKTYVNQNALIEEMQVTRQALYKMVRDIRMAGSGFAMDGSLLTEVNICVNGTWTAQKYFKITDGGNSGTDSFTVVYGEPESPTIVGNLTQDYSPGNPNSFALSPIEGNADFSGTIENGDILLIVNRAKNIAIVAGVNVSSDKKNITIDTNNYGPSSANSNVGIFEAASTRVFNIRNLNWLTYSIKTDKNTNKPGIFIDTHLPNAQSTSGGDSDNSILFALGVEDLQLMVSGLDQNGNATKPSSTLSGSSGTFPLIGVEVGIVARSNRIIDRKAWSAQIPIFNHTSVNTELDMYVRKVYTHFVMIKNFNNAYTLSLVY